jgi:hypothetical protein
MIHSGLCSRVLFNISQKETWSTPRLALKGKAVWCVEYELPPR